ncbi:TetR/AcrR family transcriptional regulator [Schleiferiaceae bacterium]|nr:TetR/AcrR family transcriptional regulator [Schleiferiaceae bacterium]
MDKLKTRNSYQNIVKQAKKLFLKHGIHRVTVQEICKEASVSKMTFYRMFKNKEDVAEKVLLEISENNIQSYRDIMKQDIPFAKRIEQMLEWKQTTSTEFSEEFIKDVFNLKESNLKTHFEEYRQKLTNELLNDLKTAQKDGWIRKDVKLTFVLYMLNDINEKLRDERFLAMYSNIKEAGMELTKFVFSGIMSNENK